MTPIVTPAITSATRSWREYLPRDLVGGDVRRIYLRTRGPVEAECYGALCCAVRSNFVRSYEGKARTRFRAKTKKGTRVNGNKGIDYANKRPYVGSHVVNDGFNWPTTLDMPQQSFENRADAHAPPGESRITDRAFPLETNRSVSAAAAFVVALSPFIALGVHVAARAAAPGRRGRRV
jgi:hypothetical protein